MAETNVSGNISVAEPPDQMYHSATVQVLNFYVKH